MAATRGMATKLWQGFVMRGIGDRIAAYRKRRGLSQAALAGLVGRSESWLSQVERGVRDVDSLSVIRELSQQLHVSPDTLIGTSFAPVPSEAGHDAADPVRHYLDRYTQLLTAPQITEQTSQELSAAAEAANSAYQGAAYEDSLRAIAELLPNVDDLVRGRADDPDAIHAYVAAYVVSAKVLHKVGENRLAALAADRAAVMASRPRTAGADRGLAARETVLALLYTGRPDAAEALAIDMATSLEAYPDRDDPVLLSLRGSLLLLAAVIAARRSERYEALERLHQAEQLADQLGYDANHGWTAFGPTNVAIHAVSIAAELGDAGEAVRLSHRIDPTNLPPGLMSRRAQLHLDLAWAYVQQRRDAEAILQILEVEQIAPQLVQYHPVIRQSVRDILGRSRTGSTGVLHDLAVRTGILS